MKKNIRKNSVFANNEQETPENCYAIIYCTINLINNKKYLGSRLLNGYRKCEDKYYLGSNKGLVNAVIKYGVDNFKRVIIYKLDFNESIKEFEEYFLNKFNCCNDKNYYNFVNNHFGGDTFSYKSEELKNITKDKLRNIAIKRNTVANIQNPKVIEENRKRCIENNPMKSKTTEEIISFNKQKKPVIIIFEKDNIELKYPGIKAAARALSFPESTFKFRYRKFKNKMINGWLIKDQ